MHNRGIKFLLAFKNALFFKKCFLFFHYINFFLKLAKVLYRTRLIQKIANIFFIDSVLIFPQFVFRDNSSSLIDNSFFEIPSGVTSNS